MRTPSHGAMTFGHIAIEPKRVSDASWWVGQPADGFTERCAKAMQTHVPLDDVSSLETVIYQRRADVLATLIGLRKGKALRAVQGTDVVRRH